ncbi:amino acid ABC transporter substrate-binding protein [Nitrogeniibacter mangrovi]|uniref:Amino acid ABC transporter substrate-binding protein n=1 Tax=Nitrogeniibacter mangrovi TaxID=2016596 RepID=A0A6C1B1Q6_9RHOO|nr:transporter substrate-binding domain-containing protein [Nitrogeniibacter mangrovi]QID17497.1 amino acid ABC transporter substrate-binding protein [Nitrogeniibacter mangrovi]
MSRTKSMMRALALCAGLVLGATASAVGATAPQTHEAGRLRIAVYNDFAPYSDNGKGVDVAIGRELAKRLGLQADIVGFNADEDMNDDLRNMVWKGHYLGTQPADVMLHVPVDHYLEKKNEQVHIFGPYHLETIAIARNPQRVPPVAGSAARALEVFTHEKIGVEVASLPDDFLLSVLNGRLRENVTHFMTIPEAVAALKKGEIAAVMATRAELEGALGTQSKFEISEVQMPELRIKGWPIGMAVKADNASLQAALSKALEDIYHDGTLDRIFAQHGITHRVP